MATTVPPSAGNGRKQRSANAKKRIVSTQVPGRSPRKSGTSRTPLPRGVRRRSAGVAEPSLLVEIVRWLSRYVKLPSHLADAHMTSKRFVIVWALLVVGGVGLTANLFRLQVMRADTLRARAQEQQMVYLRPFMPRRPIIDQLGNTLAVDRPVYRLYAHPKLFKQPKEAIAAELAPILNRTPGDLITLFNEGETGLEVEYSLVEDGAKRVAALGVDGLELLEHQQRLYPHQNLFADVVGFVNADRVGQAGVEYTQQRLLERSGRGVELNRTGDGSILPKAMPRGFVWQDDLSLKLTVDSRLQRIVQTALRDKMKEYKAKRGTVLVMDVHDGSLLALATEPTYDPNEYYKADLAQLRSWALTDVYEPGSTFKPINVAIAIESGKVRPNEVFHDDGQIYIGEWTIQNNDYDQNGPRGPQSVSDIVKYSSNVGMVRIMQQLKASEYYEWLEKLGLGQSTGVDLPFEAAGAIKTKSQFEADPIEPATTAFGQGFSLTPLQLIQLHSAIANGGLLVTPHVVDGLYTSDNQPYWQPNRPTPRRLFSPETTKAVLAMMEEVVSSGTGETAQINGYRVAGKTGTAQKASESGGYAVGLRITSFVSIFPVEAPRYAVLVVVDEPQGADAYGSTVAAPVSKLVMDALITTEHLPPSKPIRPNQADTAEDLEDF